VCDATTNVEKHHVKKLSKKVKAKNSIHQIMSKLGRKQAPLCERCHKNIHSGTYNNKSPRKAK